MVEPEKIPSIIHHEGSDDIANAVADVICLAFEHDGQFVMPETYGERVCSDWNLYMAGLSDSPVRERFW